MQLVFSTRDHGSLISIFQYCNLKGTRAFSGPVDKVARLFIYILFPIPNLLHSIPLFAYNSLFINTMSESPAPSDPEKGTFSNNKLGYDNSTPIYDEAVGESEAIEFGETKELK